MELPKKRGSGVTKTTRYARIRNDKQQQYLQKVSHTARQCFLTNNKTNVTGIVVATDETFAIDVLQSYMFNDVGYCASFYSDFINK